MAKQPTLKQRREEAKKIVGELNDILKEAESSISQLDQSFKDVQKSKDEIQKLKPAIERAKNSATRSINSLRTQRDQIKRTLTSVDRYYNKKFKPLQSKLNDPSTGLKAQLETGIKLERDIRQVKDRYHKDVAEVRRMLVGLKKQSTDLKKIDSQLRKIDEEIKKKSTSVDKLHTVVEQHALKVETWYKSFKEKETEVTKIGDKIQGVLSESEKARDKINENQVQSEDRLKRIQEIYEVAGSIGLGGEFDKRRKVLEENLEVWWRRVFWITAALFAAIVVLFALQLKSVDWRINELNFGLDFYVRFLFTSPLIFILVFSTGQYRRSKALLEKYAFKSALALSIDAHVQMLTTIENLQKANHLDSICEFILSGFEKIYAEPFLREKKNLEEPRVSLESLENLLKRFGVKG